MPKKLFITEERMLKLVDLAIRQGLARNKTDYFDKIGFPSKSERIVKAGRQGFTREQIYNACVLTGASADYVFGFTTVIRRKPKTKAIDQLKDAVMAIEIDLKSA